MNKKINEIARLAGLTVTDEGEILPAYLGSKSDGYKKFAELIVRECCDIFVELRTRPADLAVLDVKKHFGVEE